MHLARGLSSKLIIPPCVRACVPLLGEAQNPSFCIILSEISENHLCILQYLADVALKTPEPRSASAAHLAAACNRARWPQLSTLPDMALLAVLLALYF